MRDLTIPLLMVALAVAACSSPSPDSTAGGTSSTRSADKDTCVEVGLDSAYPPLDRRLVPYSPVLLGVETEWGDDAQHVLVVSGGYLDDIFEPYDDLELYSTTDIGGFEAELLNTVLLDRSVHAAVWRTTEDSPCDAKAVIATGFDRMEFDSLLTGIVQPDPE